MSRANDGAATRKERLAMLMDLVEKQPDLTENRIKGLLMLRTGLTQKAVDRMIEDLIMCEILKREGLKLSYLSQ